MGFCSFQRPEGAKTAAPRLWCFPKKGKGKFAVFQLLEHLPDAGAGSSARSFCKASLCEEGSLQWWQHSCTSESAAVVFKAARGPDGIDLEINKAFCLFVCFKPNIPLW